MMATVNPKTEHDMSTASDTIAIFQILKQIPNVSEDEARRLANGIAHNSELATKADLVSVESALRSDLSSVESALKSDLSSVESSLRSDITNVERKIAELRSEMQRDLRNMMWTVIGLFIASQAVTLTVIGLLL